MSQPNRTNQYGMKLMQSTSNGHAVQRTSRKYWFQNRTGAYKIAPIIRRLRQRMSEIAKQAVDIVKDPASYSHTTYYWVIFLSMWGGVVRIMREIKFGGKSWKEIIFIFIAELLTSGFAGVVTFYSCEQAGFQPLYTAVMTSIAGYMGGRALSLMEELYQGHTRRKGDSK